MNTGLATLRRSIEDRPTVQKALLGCGVVSSAWYVASDILATLRYDGYTYTEQQISELMAAGAPTRPLLIALLTSYNLLVVAFGVGIWLVASSERAARVAAALLVAYASLGQVGLVLFPMNTREVLAAGERGVANTMHPITTAALSLVLLLIMVSGSRLLGRRFRYFTYGIIVTLVVFGSLVSLQIDKMVANEPTPWMGIGERVSIYATMLWMAVFAIGLMRPRGLSIPPRSWKPNATPQGMPHVG